MYFKEEDKYRMEAINVLQSCDKAGMLIRGASPYQVILSLVNDNRSVTKELELITKECQDWKEKYESLP